MLETSRSTDAVGELHAETPPFAGMRGYVTASWIRESAKPAVITAAERPVLQAGRVAVGLGAGLLWLEVNDYRPYPMLVSSTVVPLPIPRPPSWLARAILKKPFTMSIRFWPSIPETWRRVCTKPWS